MTDKTIHEDVEVPKQPQTSHGDAVDKSPKKKTKLRQSDKQIQSLTDDLQRLRADFENYRKRADNEKQAATLMGKEMTVLQLIPVIDNIERAVSYLPDELKDNSWAKSVSGLAKNLDKSLSAMKLERIDAKEGMLFNPELHEAVQFDEDSEGDTEVIAEELQTGYFLEGRPIRHAMVKVTKR